MTKESMKLGWKNCGPVALGNALGVDPLVIRRSWVSQWDDPTRDTTKLGLPIDTPWHHIRWMHHHGTLAVFHTDPVRTLVEAVPGRTVFLLHNPSSPILEQHWARLYQVQEPDIWIIDWDGGGTFKALTTDNLLLMLSKGWPFCAYTIDPDLGQPNLPGLTWWQRLYLWLTSGG